MKKTTFNRHSAAHILVIYRKTVRENQKHPTGNNWDDVKRYYHRVSTLGMLGIISGQAQQRALSMFEACTAV